MSEKMRFGFAARNLATTVAVVMTIMSLAIPGLPAKAETPAHVEDLRVTIDRGRVRLYVRTSAPVEPRAHWLPQTGRDLFVVDLPGVRIGSASLPRRPGAPLLYAAAAQWRSSPPVARLALHFAKRLEFRREGGDTEFEWIIGSPTMPPAEPPSASIAPTSTSAEVLAAQTSSGAQAAAPVQPAAAADGEITLVIAPPAEGPTPPPAPPTPAPNWRDRRVTLAFRDARLSDVLRVIGEQNGLSILIHPDVTGQVSVYLESTRLEDALRSILAAHGYTFRVENDLVTVLPARLDFASYRVWFLKTPRGGTLPDLLGNLVPPPSRLFYYPDANAVVLFAAAPSVAELVEAALMQLDRTHPGN